MLKNILALSLRNLKKYRVYTIVNVLGLSLGIACCVLIFSYVHHELNFDNYHKDANSIFRVESFHQSENGEFYNNSVAGPVGPMLAESSSAIETMGRLIPPFENKKNVLIQKQEDRYFETNIYFADPQITDIFSYEFLSGDPESALNDPNLLVITESMAMKYFGRTDVVGEILNVEIDYDWYIPVVREDYTISAVIKDTPSNTHVPITMLLSMNTMRKHLPWIDEYWRDHHRKYTYIKLKENAEITDLEPQLKNLAELSHETYQQATGREWLHYYMYLQPLTKIHTDTNVKYKIIPEANRYHMNIYSLIALVVLIIGCLNFINISVSIGMKNVKQMGIRKIVGAKKHQLVLQCYIESFVYALLSFLIAFCLIEIMLPFFNQLTSAQMRLLAFFNYKVILASIGLLLSIVLLSGSYNAFVLTNVRSSNILRGNLLTKGKGSMLQRVLVIIQFAVILAFLTSSFFIFRQLNYMRGSSLGFDKEQKIVIPFKTHLERLRNDNENIKTVFKNIPNVTGATVSSGVPGHMSGGYYLRKAEEPDGESKWFNVLTTDTDFIDEFKLEILAGRKFELDADNGYIINETGMRLLGYMSPEEALGNEFFSHYHRLTKPITGVIRDFHFKGMQELVTPLVLDIEKSLYQTLTLTVKQGDLPSTIRGIKDTFEEQFPATPFSFSFLDEDFDKLYKHETQIGMIVGIVALLGIAIAAFGLFGLVSFFIVQKTKEISVRKVLGSTVAQLVSLFSLRYIRLIFLAMALAFPLSWWLVSSWLQGFAYRINLNAIPFILSGLITLIISVSVVSLRCLSAANTDPVKALKYE